MATLTRLAFRSSAPLPAPPVVHRVARRWGAAGSPRKAGDSVRGAVPTSGPPGADLRRGKRAARRRWLPFVFWVLLVGCRRAPPDSSPEGVVRLWLERMEASIDDPRATEEVYELLGPRARANLEERARRTSMLTGQRAEPSAMLAPGRFGLRFRPKAMVATVADERATVLVTGAEASERALVQCVREGGRWRIEPGLPEPLPMVSRDGGRFEGVH